MYYLINGANFTRSEREIGYDARRKFKRIARIADREGQFSRAIFVTFKVPIQVGPFDTLGKADCVGGTGKRIGIVGQNVVA